MDLMWRDSILRSSLTQTNEVYRSDDELAMPNALKLAKIRHQIASVYLCA